MRRRPASWGHGGAFDIDPSRRLATASGGDVVVAGPTGYKIRFVHNADGSYQAPAGFDGALANTGSGWVLTRSSAGDLFRYDGSGNLVGTQDAAGRDFTVQTTSAAGHTVLSSYGTSSGRRANFSYNGDNLVREFDDPASGHHYYTYSLGRLTQYGAADGQQTSYEYDSNGVLRRVLTPSGDVLEIVSLPDGRVQTLTAKPVGGLQQRFSFDYAHRPYRTYVTNPQATRRAYVRDDAYRVTRDYNPDQSPTVTASGPLYERAGGFTDGQGSLDLTVDASEPDGSGIVRVAAEKVGAGELAHVAPTCVDTPFDHICPQTTVQTVHVDLTTLAEGEHSVRAVARDDEENVGRTEPWTFSVDRTAPAVVSGFSASFDDEDSSAQISWSVPDDPLLADGTPGSGAAEYLVRIRREGGAWSPWIRSDETSVDLSDSQEGEHVDVAVAAFDAVGNGPDVDASGAPLSGVASTTLTVGADACVPADFMGTDPLGLGVQLGATSDSVGPIDTYSFATPMTPDDFLTRLPIGADVVSVVEATTVALGDLTTSGLSVTESLSLEDNLGLFYDFMRKDADDFRDELDSRYDDASELVKSDIRVLRTNIALRLARYEASGGVPISGFGITHDPAVASAVASEFAPELGAADIGASQECGTSGDPEPEPGPGGEQPAPGASARSAQPLGSDLHGSGAARRTARPRSDSGNVKEKPEKNVRKNSYSPSRIRIGSDIHAYVTRKDHKRVRYFKVSATWRWGKNSNRSYWWDAERKYNPNTSAKYNKFRGFEVQVDMNRESNGAGGSFGYPPWGANPGPNGHDYGDIPGVWTANFPCAYADDYYLDNVKSKYSLTVGGFCRPRSKKFYRWSHILSPQDETDWIRPSVTPVHWRNSTHGVVQIGPFRGTETDYCVIYRRQRTGSCMFTDGAPAVIYGERTDIDNGTVVRTPGSGTFKRTS